MIISVHLPRTGGTSFLTVLEKHFGTSLRKDYGDLPANTPVDERNQAALDSARGIAELDYAGVDCIHGHFLPVKYHLLAERREVLFVTWLRHPVERIISHYHFWKRTYDPVSVPALHRRVVEEDWSLERLCLSREMKDLCGQFFWKFPPSKFSFIGLTECFEEDLDHFGRQYLGKPLTNCERDPGDRKKWARMIDASLRKAIETHHGRDMDLYEWALRQREKRCRR
jgi:hypothetical protein